LKIFIDTNIIIYFLEKNEQFHKKVSGCFEKAERKEIELFTSSLSYMEVLVPIIKTKNTSLESQYNFLFKDFLNLIAIGLEVARIAASLRGKYPIRTPDALQIACAVKAHCDMFVTADSTLKKIKDIKVTLID